MSLDGQRLQPDRYQVIPRTLCFLLREDQILLLRLAPERGAWGGKYNGVGGHIEQGEDPTSAARREILEETGYKPTPLLLSGVVIIDSGKSPGIALYVYVGEVEEITPPIPNREGSLRWVKLAEAYNLPLVEDLPDLLPRTIESFKTKHPFSAAYSYDHEGRLSIQFQT